MQKTPLNKYQEDAIIEIVEKHKAELLLNMNRMIDDIAENMKAELRSKMQDLTVYG